MTSRRILPRVAPIVLALAAVAVYANSFGAPFLFDDVPSIVENGRIARFWPPWKFLAADWREDVTVAGRPVAEASFALDRAIGHTLGGASGGLDPRVFHATNLLIHVLAGLALFGVVRRTLRLVRLEGRFADSADLVAFAVALVWLVHPLQTESVTYVVQRVESLAGLCLLVTLYASIRAAESERSASWTALAIGACLLGVGAKETMVVAPLLVLLHDRTFVAGSFRAAWSARRTLYLGLLASWIPLAALVLSSPRLRVADAGAQSFTSLEYLSAQGPALVRYLQLAFWPAGLVFDYGVARAGVPIPAASAWIPGAIVALAILVASIVGLARGRAWGFLGACFVLLLAPSSSVVPIRLEVLAEHRMYLPLAALVVAVAVAIARIGKPALLIATLAISVGLGIATVKRNRDYASDLAIWSDTVAKRPDNARALTNLGLALLARGDVEGALARQRAAVECGPAYAEGWHNLGAALARAGRLEEAAGAYRESLRIEPDSHLAHKALGIVLHGLGRRDEALAEYELALAIGPLDAALQNQAGIVLAELGRFAEAARRFQLALIVDPEHAGARANLERLRAEAQPPVSPGGGGR